MTEVSRLTFRRQRAVERVKASRDDDVCSGIGHSDARMSAHGSQHRPDRTQLPPGLPVSALGAPPTSREMPRSSSSRRIRWFSDFHCREAHRQVHTPAAPMTLAGRNLLPVMMPPAASHRHGRRELLMRIDPPRAPAPCRDLPANGRRLGALHNQNSTAGRDGAAVLLATTRAATGTPCSCPCRSSSWAHAGALAIAGSDWRNGTSLKNFQRQLSVAKRLRAVIVGDAGVVSSTSCCLRRLGGETLRCSAKPRLQGFPSDVLIAAVGNIYGNQQVDAIGFAST